MNNDSTAQLNHVNEEEPKVETSNTLSTTITEGRSMSGAYECGKA